MNRLLDHPEILDDLDFAGAELEKSLKEIETINKWFGGQGSFISTAERLIRQELNNKDKLTIIDLGCGSGADLKALCERFEMNELNRVEFIGIDANKNVVSLAQKWTEGKPIRFCAENVLHSNPAETGDIVLASLFFHHFTESEIQKVAEKYVRVGGTLLISDLHRSSLALVLFKLLSFAMGMSPMSKNDGSLSVKRGFTKKELLQLFLPLSPSRYIVRSKWAFRFHLELTL